MPPQSLRVSAHKFDHRFVSVGAICAIVDSLTLNAVAASQGDGEVPDRAKPCTDMTNTNPTALAIQEPSRVEGFAQQGLKQTLAKGFITQLHSIVKTMIDCPVKEEFINFLENDWRMIESALDGGEIVCAEKIKSHWRKLDSTMADSNDLFLREGAMLLNLILGDTNPAPDFYAGVEGLDAWISGGLHNDSMPPEGKSHLRKLKRQVLQCRDKVKEALESEMSKDKTSAALIAQHTALIAQCAKTLDGIPDSPYRYILKRHCHKCLMDLQQCQLPPLRTPEFAAFSRSLRAIIGNVGDSQLFSKMFAIIYQTLKNADNATTPELASRLAAQWNDILPHQAKLLSPAAFEILKAQGEAALKRISAGAAETAAELESESEGWLSKMVNSVSDRVHQWFGAGRHFSSEELAAAMDRPVTAIDAIASINTVAAVTISKFMESVKRELTNVSLEGPQLVALHRLLDLKTHVVGPLAEICEKATTDELESSMKKGFINHVNSLWSPLTSELDPEIVAALDTERNMAFTKLTQTSTMRSLLQQVTKFTSDPRVMYIISFILLSTFVNGSEGAPVPDTAVATKSTFALQQVGQEEWDQFFCSAFKAGSNVVNYWIPLSKPYGIYTCTDGTSNKTSRALQAYDDLHARTSCSSDNHFRVQGTITYDKNGVATPDGDLTRLSGLSKLALDCRKSFSKWLRNFKTPIIQHFCESGRSIGSSADWNISLSNTDSGFGFCTDSGDVNTLIPQLQGNPDEFQLAQFDCRRHLRPIDEWTVLQSKSVPDPLVTEVVRVKYQGEARQVLEGCDKLDSQGQLTWLKDDLTFTAPCLKDWSKYKEFKRSSVSPKVAVTEVTELAARTTATTQLGAPPTQPTQPPPAPPTTTYVLGAPSTTATPGEHSMVTIDGVDYGLYESTPSGLVPVTNETYEILSHPLATTEASGSGSGGASASKTPAPGETATGVQNVTFPSYPPVPMSTVTSLTTVAPNDWNWWDLLSKLPLGLLGLGACGMCGMCAACLKCKIPCRCTVRLLRMCGCNVQRREEHRHVYYDEFGSRPLDGQQMAKKAKKKLQAIVEQPEGSQQEGIPLVGVRTSQPDEIEMVDILPPPEDASVTQKVPGSPLDTTPPLEVETSASGIKSILKSK
eukprot:Blabericola_migrator_1__2752@NODE_1786_length_3792_cov_16_617718_g1151_i0_p1_GENE_NODE_1786_length_3792_cov_16_617718_g1151_i0NODE_1786_length_3792_cov_16_617718_g1151_i0_p1_ORF_typecomplete_len1132_score193_69ABATE/PF07336_11/4_8ABATE/PF07336_11/1_1e02_NODE_1786_length_3792_cov_16_617718_g1151_i02863681